MYMLMKIKHVTNKRFPQILSSRYKIPVMGSWISQVNFCLQEEGIEKKHQIKKKKIQLTCRITGTQKPPKLSNSGILLNS